MSGKVREPISPSNYTSIFTHSNEVTGKTIVEPEDEIEKNKVTTYVKTSSGKTISIKCDENRKQRQYWMKSIEDLSAIPRVMTYLVHRGKVLNEKKTTEENNIGTETTIEMSLRLLGGTDKSKKRKLAEVSEGALTRPSEDALFFKEVIDALERSEEKTTK